MKKLYRSAENGKIAGVCGGLAEYFDLDPVIVRVVFVSLIPLGIVTYFVMWLMVPLKQKEILSSGSIKRLYLSDQDRKIAGVCGGLGEYFNQDSTIFRILFVVLVFIGGLGIPLYIILWLAMPSRKITL